MTSLGEKAREVGMELINQVNDYSEIESSEIRDTDAELRALESLNRMVADAIAERKMPVL